MRLDLWLWSIRAFKTRSLALAAIKGGKVRVNGASSKPSHAVRAGEIIAVMVDAASTPWTRTLRVLASPVSRVGAKLTSQYVDDITEAEELEKSRMRGPLLPGYRPPGSGRPTKRDRRELDEFGEGSVEGQ
jgi:ribosome-associated heat shock protein Hsp15